MADQNRRTRRPFADDEDGPRDVPERVAPASTERSDYRPPERVMAQDAGSGRGAVRMPAIGAFFAYGKGQAREDLQRGARLRPRKKQAGPI